MCDVCDAILQAEAREDSARTFDIGVHQGAQRIPSSAAHGEAAGKV